MESVRPRSRRKTKSPGQSVAGAMSNATHASLYVNICCRAESTSRHGANVILDGNESSTMNFKLRPTPCRVAMTGRYFSTVSAPPA
jgi:hypothetical protein